MSKFVQVKTELREMAFIKQALDDLKLEWAENASYRHVYSNTTRQGVLLVKNNYTTFALEPNAEGVCQVLFDDMQRGSVQTLVGAIQQRYAYHKVIAEAARSGFDLVEESTGQDKVIRLTVRRWS